MRLTGTGFELGNFRTALFGGLYLFPTVDHPAVISVREAATLGRMPIKDVFDLRNRNLIASEHPAYFYTLHAADTADRVLVNMLPAEFSPLDLRQLFICHKAPFYRRYATWPDAKKEHVADFLKREYQVDKAGARAALFGHESDMTGAAPRPPAGESDTGAR